MARPYFGIVFASVALALMTPSAAVPAATNQSPFIGQWELDLSRMPETYGPPPKRVVYAFEDVGSGEWRTTIDMTASGTLRCNIDGTERW